MQLLELEVTTTGIHTGSQALSEVATTLLIWDVFLWQLFPDGLQGDFQLINRLGLQLEFYGTFPAWHPRCDSLVGSNPESLGPMILFYEPRTICLQPVAPCELGRRLDGGWSLLTACVTAVPMVVTSSICSKGLFPSLYLHLSTKNQAHFRATHTLENNVGLCSLPNIAVIGRHLWTLQLNE